MSETAKSEKLKLETLRSNLARAGSRAFASYQQTMDTSLFFMSGSMLANEKDYNELKSGYGFAPSERHALSFERAKFETQRLALKNSLQQGLAALVVLLEDLRVVSSMTAHLGKEGEELGAAVKEVTGKPRSAFLKLSLPSKLDHLKEQFQIPSHHKQSVESFLKVVNCLQSNGGVVGKADADESGALNVPLMSFGLAEDKTAADSKKSDQSSEEKLQVQVRPRVKTIRLGQAIDFSHAEHIAAILTFCVLTGALVQSAGRYLDSKAPAEPSRAG